MDLVSLNPGEDPTESESHRVDQYNRRRRDAMARAHELARSNAERIPEDSEPHVVDLTPHHRFLSPSTLHDTEVGVSQTEWRQSGSGDACLDPGFVETYEIDPEAYGVVGIFGVQLVVDSDREPITSRVDICDGTRATLETLDTGSALRTPGVIGLLDEPVFYGPGCDAHSGVIAQVITDRGDALLALHAVSGEAPGTTVHSGR